jgi:3-oxoacyl-[acyl-carrier-protein] synthase I
VSVAVAGWALRTPLANDPGTFLGRLLAGERGFSSTPPTDGLVAARIAGEPRSAEVRRWQLLGRVERFAVDAAKEALGDRRCESERLAIFWATGGPRVRWEETRPALVNQRPDGQRCWEGGLRLLHPFWLLQHLSNNAQALLAIDLGARGGGGVWSGANAGAQAVAGAARALHSGAIDLALVVAGDSLLAPEAQADDAWRWSQRLRGPYDLEADGAVPGEGAAALLLEREARTGPDVRISATSGAHAVAAAIDRILPDRAPPALLIDGAGLGRTDRDHDERMILARRVGDGAPLGAVTAATGQLGAATSLVQIIALGGLLQRRRAAPVAGLAAPAPGPLRPLTCAEPTVARVALGVTLPGAGLVGLVRVEVA